VANELHDLIRKVRRHLVDPAYRLTPAELAQTEQRIAELGGRQGWLRYKRLATASPAESTHAEEPA
jgi:hypothetical protein